MSWKDLDNRAHQINIATQDQERAARLAANAAREKADREEFEKRIAIRNQTSQNLQGNLSSVQAESLLADIKDLWGEGTITPFENHKADDPYIQSVGFSLRSDPFFVIHPYRNRDEQTGLTLSRRFSVLSVFSEPTTSQPSVIITDSGLYDVAEYRRTSSIEKAKSGDIQEANLDREGNQIPFWQKSKSITEVLFPSSNEQSVLNNPDTSALAPLDEFIVALHRTQKRRKEIDSLPGQIRQLSDELVEIFPGLKENHGLDPKELLEWYLKATNAGRTSRFIQRKMFTHGLAPFIQRKMFTHGLAPYS